MASPDGRNLVSIKLGSRFNRCLRSFGRLIGMHLNGCGKYLAFCFAAVSVVPLGVSADDLGELEARCEQAREAKIAPERAKRIEECVTKGEKPDRQSCERYFATYGDRSGNRPRLHYDLPECQKAFDARQGTSRRSVD
jgi:hypothetical protein